MAIDDNCAAINLAPQRQRRGKPSVMIVEKNRHESIIEVMQALEVN